MSKAIQRSAGCAALLVIGSLAAAPAAGQTGGTVAFVNANVIPMDRDTVLREQTVVVRDGRIVAVGPAAGTEVPDGATRVDASGKYLVPGLAEMHGHIPAIQPDGTNQQFAEDVLFLYVAAGATTVRGMQGHPSQIELRERVERGELIGPKLYLAAPQLGGNVQNADSARARVRQAKEAGFDLLKIQEGLSSEVYAAVVDEAKQQSLPWGGHVPNDVGLHGVLSAGQVTIDHLDNYIDALEAEDSPVRNASPQERARQLALHVDESKIPELARATKEAGVAVVPTMSLWETLRGHQDVAELQARTELKYMPMQLVQDWTNRASNMRANADTRAAAREVEIRMKMLAALHEAGVEILMGTDAPQIFSVPGFSLYHELPVMVASGMTPYQVLATGSVNVARHFGAENDAGTVTVGKRADLLLLDGNPLEDISNVEKRAGVMVNGRWLPESEIQRRLAEIEARTGS